MTIKTELDTLKTAIDNIKTEVRNHGQTVETTDTVASLAGKIDNIENKDETGYSKSVLNDIIEGTIEYLYDEILLYLRPYALCSCEHLHTAYFTKLKKICRHSFDSCYTFRTLVLAATENIVLLDNDNAFRYTPFEEGEGFIYVPDALLNTYKSADCWQTFKTRFKKLSEFSN